MKVLVGGICAFFVALLAATLFLALRLDEGLVEDDYYAKADRYLAAREEEERISLAVALPDRLSRGSNHLTAEATTAAGPLTGARATLRAARPGGGGRDLAFPMREEAPGVYAAEAVIPEGGIWLLSLALDGEKVRTDRRWFVTAVPGPGTGDGGGDVHAGPVRLSADGQDVTLEISPRPIRAMSEIEFTVTLPEDGGAGAPRIDLAMPGMRMSPNRVDLARGADGRWRGKGLLVRCPRGGTTWTAAVTLPAGARAEVTFDVAD